MNKTDDRTVVWRYDGSQVKRTNSRTFEPSNTNILEPGTCLSAEALVKAGNPESETHNTRKF
jgi:hypothetical protein